MSGHPKKQWIFEDGFLCMDHIKLSIRADHVGITPSMAARIVLDHNACLGLPDDRLRDFTNRGGIMKVLEDMAHGDQEAIVKAGTGPSNTAQPT